MNNNLLPRKQIKAISNWLFDEVILLLVGSRHAGKTSLMYLLMDELKKEGVSEDKIVYFDLEDLNLLDICNGGPHNFLLFLESKGFQEKDKFFVFLDEIQYLENPSNFLKLIADHHKNIKLIVSGSSSLEIRQKFKDSLAGRKIIFEIFPLDFLEFLIFKGRSDLHNLISQVNLFSFLKTGKVPDISKLKFYFQELTGLYEEYVLYGGYPRVTLEKDHFKKQYYLKDIYNSYVRKDIKDLMRIDNVTAFNNLIRVLALQIGNLVNFNELSVHLGLARETLQRYLFLLENTFIIKLVPPFYSNRRKEIVKMPKIFFDDTGLRNVVINNFSQLNQRTDMGQLAENAVYSQLIKNWPAPDEIFFWRTQSQNEVDFIIGGKSPTPLEIKYQNMLKPSIPSGIRSFIQSYEPASTAVLTKNYYYGELVLHNSQILFAPCWLLS